MDKAEITSSNHPSYPAGSVMPLGGIQGWFCLTQGPPSIKDTDQRVMVEADFFEYGRVEGRIVEEEQQHD